MIRKMSMWFATAALALGLCSAAMAAVPTVIPFQGRLTDAAGTAITGSKSIRFSLWNALTAGAEQWFEVNPTVTVANGLFSVALGSVTALPAGIFTGGELYLEIAVGTDAAMTPRQRLGSVAYAERAGIQPGVASTTGTSIAANGVENLASVAVTFPTAGTAVVLGRAELTASLAAGGQSCYGIFISDVSATMQSPAIYDCQQNTGSAGVYHELGLPIMRVFTVAAGAKTFFLVGQEQLGQWTVITPQIVVQFFPDAIGPVSEPQQIPAKAHAVGIGSQ